MKPDGCRELCFANGVLEAPVMPGARRSRTEHGISLEDALEVEVTFDDIRYRICVDDGMTVTGSNGTEARVGTWAKATSPILRVQFTPGCETYFSARAERGNPFDANDIAAAVVVAAIAGHPDAEKEREGVELSAVWSHHLAIVGGEDPRRVATTYAPTETKRISHRVQHMATLGIDVSPSS
jgi:hypothetical protein